ncbi:MAG: hypothetical protein DRI90_21865 [Deltaproteobacteria bacterium]|nr:MAG: hypothetical protein DRI90_21865 [Deltaproteobacteria bacterium]
MGSSIGCSGVSADPAPPEPVIPIASITSVAQAAGSGTSAAAAAPELGLSVLDAAHWMASDTGGDAGVWRLGYRFDGNRYTTSGYPPWEESGRVALVEVDGRRMLLKFDDRVYDGKDDDPVNRWVEIAADDQSFAMGGMVFQRQPHEATVAADSEETAQR